MSFKSVAKAAALLSIVFLVVGQCVAQTTRGIVAGVVTDSTGAVVVGATVDVERMEGGDKRSVTTGSNGEYRVEALTPGTYKVTVKASNFSTVELTRVEVSASVTTPANVKLDVGKAEATIMVEASGQQIQTETGELSGVIPTAQVKDLPILSGNPYALAITLPGVATPDERDDFTNGTGFSVDGLRPRGNNFLLDGFDNNDYGITGQALQPTNQEAVAEVTVLKNAYSAEYGRGGGSVSNLTFKSGTNTLHGAAWWQYSGASLNAVTIPESENSQTRPSHLVNNLYGFTVGGPIVKDKLFFFGTSQWFRSYGSQPAATLTMPTAAGVATLESIGPNANIQLLLDSLAGLRAQTADGFILVGDRPGCTPCSVDVGPLTRTDAGVSLSREWTVRADFLPTTSDTVYARYTDTRSSLTPDLFANSTALPSADTEQGGPARNFGIMWAHTFSPTVLNELRFSGQQIDFGFNPTAATLANPIAHSPGINLSTGLDNLFWGGFGQGTFPQGRAHKTFQFQDAVSIIKGSHTLKLGADIAVILVNDGIPFDSDGLLTYNPGGACMDNGVASTCTALANYIDDFSGQGGFVDKQFGNPNINVPTSQQGYYVQDTWKVRSNFTLDLGLRYEYQPPDAANVLAFPSLDRATALTAPFDTRTRAEPDRNNWGPRIGFSYSPKFWSRWLGEDKTVLRGGAGIFFDSFFTNISNNSASSSPNTLGFSETQPNTGRGTADFSGILIGISPTSSPLATVFTQVSNLRNPMTYQWNLNVQRQLPGHIVAEVAYVGTRAERLWVNEQLNPRDPNTPDDDRLNPDRGAILVRGNGGDSNYHGLQTQITRNFGRLSLRGAYTWSKSIDNGSEVFVTTGGATRWQNTMNPRSDRGPSAFDRRNRAAITWVYEFPSPGNGLLKALVGGWTTTGSVIFQSGPPETIYFGGFDQNGDGEFFNDRPSGGNPNAPLNFSDACLNDINCITGFGLDLGGGTLIDANTGAPGTFNDFRYIANLSFQNGNVQRNSLYLPGEQTWNLGVIKRFKLSFREGSDIEIRADFFNAFNHPNEGQRRLVGLGDLLDPSGFADFARTKDGSRQIQTWLKFHF